MSQLRPNQGDIFHNFYHLGMIFHICLPQASCCSLESFSVSFKNWWWEGHKEAEPQLFTRAVRGKSVKAAVSGQPSLEISITKPLPQMGCAMIRLQPCPRET